MCKILTKWSNLIQLISYHFFLFLNMYRPGAINYPTPRKCVYFSSKKIISFPQYLWLHFWWYHNSMASMCTRKGHSNYLYSSSLRLLPPHSAYYLHPLPILFRFQCLSKPLGSFKPTPTPLPQKTHERYPQMLKSYGFFGLQLFQPVKYLIVK